MPSLKNWDNQTWLSSKEYIQSFNNFVLKQLKINKNSKILDIGCGRGKIIENLSNKLKLINKPVGLDIENYKDRSKKIIFKKSDAITYIYKTRVFFDLILIKQTIHLLQTTQIIKLLFACKNKLNPGGKIIILSLDQDNNEIPTFSTMDKKLKKSLKRDKKIFNLIVKAFKNIIIKSFVFRVKISRKEYVKMIKKRYISTLLNFNEKQILDGINEINLKYKKELKFKDRLICLILNK
jgi:ubiquinone/menaquinone biosynthesis C-methylase UbiE